MSVAQAPGHDPQEAFAQEIGSIRQRLWLERAGLLVTRALMFGFLLTLALTVAAWYTQRAVPPLWYAIPLLVPLALALFASAFLVPTAVTAARIVDRRLDLAEQLGTAVEVVAEAPESLVAWAQVSAAADTAGWAQHNWQGGPRIGRELALTAAIGFLAAAALLLTGPEGRNLFPRPPAPALSQEGPAPAVAPSPVAAQKPQAQPSPAAQPRQPTGRTAGVQRAIEDIRRSRESGALDAGEASRRLGQAEGELSRQTQQSRTDERSLDRLGQALDQTAAGHPAAEAIARNDYAEAARQIAQLGTESDQLSQEAKQQLAQALRQAAADSASSPELAQAERRAADALAGRDYEQTRQALSDLADQVATRSQNVIPQSELSRAWDQVNQERRAQGQPDSPGSAQRQEPQNQGQRGQQGQQGQQGQGQQGQQGQSNQPQGGQGVGTAPSTGGPPGQSPEADAPAPRLDAQGQPVEVELKPGEQAGRRPGDAEKPDDDKPLDETGSMSAAATGAPGQVTSAAPPEINFVPSGRRDVVREYFRGPGEQR